MIEMVVSPPNQPVLAAGVQRLRRSAARIGSTTIPTVFVWICFGLTAGIGILFVLNARTLLPKRFFYDSGHIQAIAQQGIEAGRGDRSFTSVGQVYNILGLQDSIVLTALVSYTAITVMHLLVLRRVARPKRTPVFAVPLVIVSFAMCCVFLTSYSKDAIVLVITAIVLFAGPGLLGEIAVLSAVAVYAVSFRSYWGLVLVVYVAARLAHRYGRHRILVLAVPPIMLVVLALAYALVLHQPIDGARALANAGRVGTPDANSMISTYISLPEPFGSTLNVLVTLVTLILPIPLLARGGLYYSAVAVLLTVVWVSVSVALVRSSRVAASSRITVRSLCLALAFVTIQAIFEPDYGSVLRHLSPLLLLVGAGVGTALVRAVTAPTQDESIIGTIAARHRA